MSKREPIVMIPGPTPVDDSILKAMTHRTYGHTSSQFVQIYKETLSGLKDILMTDGEVIAVAGAGTLAMEMAVVNTLKNGDNLLVISHGHFGDRFARIAGRYGINADLLTASPGEIVDPEKIAAELKRKKYRAVTVTHVDTSTAVCAPIEDIGKVLSNYPDTLYILDGVCATGGIEENMRDWGIDVIVTTTQKALGVPPGIAICVFNDHALARKKALGTIPNYYCDIDLWLPIMHDPTKYFSTPPVNLILGLNQGIRIILDEGLEARFARHHRYGNAIRAGIKALGLDFLANPLYAAATLTSVFYPDGVNDTEFRSAMDHYGILVAGGLGPMAGKSFRIGHMGNITHQEILLTISAIELSLRRVGHNVKLGAGVGAAEAELADHL